MKRKPTNKERGKFILLSQKEKNKEIKKWAKSARWGVDDRIGSDGQIYTAFCPLWKNK